MERLQAFFGFPEMTRVGYGIAITISQELLQAHVDTCLLAGREVVTVPLGSNGKLAIVAIRPPHEPDPGDLLRGNLCNPLLLAAHEPKPADPTAISEGDVLAVRLHLPARLFVLDTAVIPLETRIALLARLVVFAVVIEAGDSGPRPLSSRLSGLRIEGGGKRIGVCQVRTRPIEIIPGDATRIHPQAQGFIADKLHDPDGFIDCGILLAFPTVSTHGACTHK